ncbi:hypothetical protein MUS1_09225 [Marinomonas ushuaiensis DSM 15871]|uniref:Uncharacterized protein n=1 Tax=Marinomonas ushuaiensis DSM 15871 TaxID=1122207 RepID=X7E8X2_9GAMM|nr:hypothetical protein MUS1_09225 [Marinomonas ushuaiensis DSM 15871]
MLINLLGLAAIAFVIYWFWLPIHRKRNSQKSK